jgi:prolipoprotein diacylglyceryltransferase
MSHAARHHLLRPYVRLPWGTWPAYRCFVFLGVLAGATYAATLAAVTGQPVALVLGLVAGGVVVSVALGLAFKALTGSEGFTFYHYQIAVLAATAGVLTLLRRPVLPFLDLIGPTLGLVQAFGRLGCLMAGCCHGRPARWGVLYGEKHAAIGFRSSLVGVRLVPVQAVESLGLFALVAGTTAAILAGSAAGTALASYLAAYAALRFALELARGDDARPYRLGFSEAQWTALACLAVVAAGETAGLLPFVVWHVALAAAVGAAVPGVALARRLRGGSGLLHARHVGEVADLLAGCARAMAASGHSLVAPPPITLGRTALGVKISASTRPGGGVHYALSQQGDGLTAASARRLARLILRLRHPGHPSRLLAGNGGVFHLLVDPPPARSLPPTPLLSLEEPA